jgi:uncharacterized protein involved in exopolysaccharide biosynthesis
VVAISRKIADLQAEIAHAPQQPAPGAAAVVTTIRPAAASTAQGSTSRGAAGHGVGKQEQARIRAADSHYESRIEASPLVEEEYKQVTRDHETALEFYNTLLKKMNESSMATALEHRQQGEQFRRHGCSKSSRRSNLSQPSYFAGGGLAAGLALGLLIAALLEYRDTSLRNERDIWAFTKLPTLAMISHIDGFPSLQKRSRWNLFSRTRKPVESAGR